MVGVQYIYSSYLSLTQQGHSDHVVFPLDVLLPPLYHFSPFSQLSLLSIICPHSRLFWCSLYPPPDCRLSAKGKWSDLGFPHLLCLVVLSDPSRSFGMIMLLPQHLLFFTTHFLSSLPSLCLQLSGVPTTHGKLPLSCFFSKNFLF